MVSKKENHSQLNFLAPGLREQLNPKHSLYQLAGQIDWLYFEKEFSGMYSKMGRPANSIRLMVSLLILKAVYNLSDEELIEKHWEMNSYFQFFSGKELQQWGQPCAASDLVHFRNRIGKSGIEKIFKHSIDLHGKAAQGKHVSIDTTVEEKNITYPTDSKLHKRIADKCVEMARKESVSIRRSYTRTTKELLRDTYNSTHPKRRKKAKSAQRKLKTIAGRLVRELDRKLPEGVYAKELDLFKRVLSQTRNSKNKIYSLHEPDVYCIAKGKAAKKYEYGCKASIVLTQTTGIIVGAMTFSENIYDGHTLEPALKQVAQLTGKFPETATADRGYKGKNQIENTQIIRPSKPLKRDTVYQKRKKRRHCKRRAAIEPVISHLKADHRVARNFLKGTIGDEINFLMAASAFNFKKWMDNLSKKLLALWKIDLQASIILLQKHISSNLLLFTT